MSTTTIQDKRTAHLKGRIYEADGRWRCTSHGDALQERGGVLHASCCGLQVTR